MDQAQHREDESAPTPAVHRVITIGRQYGSGGEGFLRLNIACPKSVLNDGLCRLKKAIEEL